jgi:hypothetical protein
VDSEIRQVDNLGHAHLDRPDPMPRWIRVPADRAARKMVNAIVRRRRKVVITAHGKLAVALERFVPGLLAHTVRMLGQKVGR